MSDRWFVQRLHPTEKGMIQIAGPGPMPKTEAAEVCARWRAEAPDLNPYIWQHQDDVRAELASDDKAAEQYAEEQADGTLALHGRALKEAFLAGCHHVRATR